MSQRLIHAKDARRLQIYVGDQTGLSLPRLRIFDVMQTESQILLVFEERGFETESRAPFDLILVEDPAD